MSEARLGDHVEILTGFPFRSADFTQDAGGVLLLRGDNIAQRRVRWEGAQRWPAERVAEVRQYQLERGDLVVAMDRPWIRAGLKVAEVRDDSVGALLVQRVARLRARSGLDQGFLKWLLYSADFTSHVLGVQTGTAVPHISAKQIADFRFVRPSLMEQRRIASVLGAVDDLIENHDRLSRAAAELAKAILLAAPRAGTARVGDVAEVRRGLSYKGAGLSDTGMPMVNMGSAASFGWLKRDGWKFYVGDYKPRHVAHARDLIITNTEQTWRQEIIGWPMIVPADVPHALFTHHTFLVDFRSDAEWLRLPLWAHLFSDEARSTFDGSIRGTTVASLPIDVVEDLRFPTPPAGHPSLRAAQSLLESAWQDEVATRELTRTRDELMPLLMSGKVRVSEDLAVA